MANALLRCAINKALRTSGTLGMSTLVLGLAANASAQDAGADTQKLDTITVTGSNIRRVDIETSNPVITVDRAEIQKSGKLTVGDLVQQLPTIAGAANNPNVNNGGGTGGSFISLRGLGTQRSLVLVDGKRVINTDVNTIPAAAIERIEVLTDGASAVYGSDAIAGVVNIILRKDYQGAELQLNYGVSDRDDGKREGFAITFGQTSDKGSLIGGIDYNKTDEILAAHRSFSRDQLTLQDGEVFIGGAPAGPGGNYAGFEAFAGCESGRGVFDASAPGGNGIPAQFRCYVDSSASGPGDTYNFSAINLITTPQERTNFFLNGNYKISDSVEAYMQVLHNHTSSAGQLAPLPFSINARSGLTITADNPYNPFGVDIGAGAPNGEQTQIRLTGLGPRKTPVFSSTNDQARVGLRGNLFDTWQWDLWGNYGHNSNIVNNVNFLNASNAGVALSGDCVMPQAGQPLSTNTCLNIFDQNDPVTQQLLQQFYSLTTDVRTLSLSRQGGFDINGTLFDLPAGAVSLAAGANYRKFSIGTAADTVSITDPLTGGCPAGSLTLCTNPFSGGYNVKEAYVEAFVPVLRDLPFIHSLNVTVGDRWSKYNTFGSTNNWKLAVEYRPIEDLLLRGTVTTVFRAPNTTELFLPLTGAADNYISPNPDDPAWDSLLGDQIQTFFTGAAVGNYAIKPEQGKSFDFGAVYDPQWLSGLSVSADLWRIYLNDLIVRPTGQTVVDFCYAANNDPSNPYCQLIAHGGGAIDSISGLTYQNFGRLDTKGVDFALNYKLPETAFGNFTLGLNTTYIAQYDVATPGAPTEYNAGQFSTQYGNFTRWRALGSVTWQMGDFSANWTQRYFGRLSINNPDFGLPGDALKIGAVVTHNLAFGYNIEPINTRIDVGIDNVGDKQPPLFYANTTTNANIDINTYDPIGRFYWARMTVKF
jgi:outer membrane receptor protein involved in Fe transport